MEKDMKTSNTADAAGSVSGQTANAAAPDPAAVTPSSHDAKIDSWFAKHFHGLGSMVDERLYNHVHAAKEDLKAEFRKL
jgi:hypothetical protein